MSEKKLILKFLESWCEIELFRRGRILPLCYSMPHSYGLDGLWQKFWAQVDTTLLVSIGDNSSSLDETTLSRMLFIHEFVNWIYE